MARRRRTTRQLSEQVDGLALVGRVAHAELGRDRKRGHRRTQTLGGRPHALLGERLALVAVGIVAARKCDDQFGVDRVGQTGSVEFGLGEADRDNRGRFAVALDKRVGRQGRRNRNEPDVARRNRSAFCSAGSFQHVANCASDTDRKVVMRGRRLGRGNDLLDAAIVSHDDRIGEGAARVDSEQ